jgi:microcystin-dependent protein
MSEAYIGEIRAFGFNYAPQNWLPCDGRLLSIPGYTSLFAILGINFGGNGTTTFGLPNLQSSVVVGAGTAVTGTSYQVGETGGAVSVQLDVTTLPTHTHGFLAAGPRFKADTNKPGPTVSFAPATDCTPYIVTPTQRATLAPTALSPSGTASSVPHNNLAPTTAMNFCICVIGQFPPRG